MNANDHRYRARGAALAGLLAAGAALNGCASGRTFVLNRAIGMPEYRTVYVHEGESPVALEPAQKQRFEGALRARLMREPALALSEAPRGDALTIEYRVIAHDKGSAAVRVVNGAIQAVGVPVSGLGDGTLGVDVIYRDSAGATLARIVADGPIAGVLGSTGAGLDSAAESIAAFTKKTFRAPALDEVALH